MERARSILINILSSTFVEELKEKVGEIYLVGGAIRDAFYGRAVKDFDFALTEIAFKETIKFLERKHIRYFTLNKDKLLLIRVVQKESTFDFVKITDNIDYDSTLRDYTINAVYYSLIQNKFFYKNISINDLRKHILRVVSSSSILYDPVRALRGIRLVGALNLSIEEKTKKEIKNGFSLLHTVKKERKREEAKKILKLDIQSLIKILKLLFPDKDFSVVYEKYILSKEFKVLDKEINRDFTYRDAFTVILFSQVFSDCPLTDILGLSKKEKEIVQRIMKEKISDDFDSLFSIFVRYREIFVPLCTVLLLFKKERAIKVGRLTESWSKIKLNGNKLKMQYNMQGKALGKLKEQLLKNACRRFYEEI